MKINLNEMEIFTPAEALEKLIITHLKLHYVNSPSHQAYLDTYSAKIQEQMSRALAPLLEDKEYPPDFPIVRLLVEIIDRYLETGGLKLGRLSSIAAAIFEYDFIETFFRYIEINWSIWKETDNLYKSMQDDAKLSASARKLYQMNLERNEIKNEINKLLGHHHVEIKVYNSEVL